MENFNKTGYKGKNYKGRIWKIKVKYLKLFHMFFHSYIFPHRISTFHKRC